MKDIFISHSTEEAPVAIALKQLLRRIFGREIEVFVSSDFRSLESGKGRYESIIRALGESKAVVALLSQHSEFRPWVLFEFGLAVGSQKLVVPFTFRGLDKNDVGEPYANALVRDLHNKNDFSAAMDELSAVLEQTPNSIDVDFEMEALREAENSIKTTAFHLVPHLGADHWLTFQLEGTIHRPLEVLQAWTAIPEDLWNSGSILPFGLSAVAKDYPLFDMVRYIRLTQHSGKIATGIDITSDFKMLPETLTSGMLPLDLRQLRFLIQGNRSGEDIIHFGINTKSGDFESKVSVNELTNKNT